MDKNSGGRPKKEIDPEDLPKIRKWAGLGLTEDQIAALLDMCERTFRNRMSEDPEVRAAWEKGKAVAARRVTGRLWANIKDGDKASIFFYLKTQLGWKETQVVETHDKTLERELDQLPDPDEEPDETDDPDGTDDDADESAEP